MPKRKYKLEAVIDLRKSRKDDAVRIASLKRKELEIEEDELSKRQNDLSAIRAEISVAAQGLTRDLTGGTRASSILKHKDYLEGLKAKESESALRVAEQREACELARAACDAALALLAEASKELSAIEKHKDNWSFGEKKRENKQEQKLLDEIGSILHGRSKKL